MIENTTVRNFLRPILDFIDPGRKLRRYIEKKIAEKRYSGVAVNIAEFGNAKLSEYIADGRPFCAGKFGATESKTYLAYLNLREELEEIPGTIREEIFLHSGVFPTEDSDLIRFSQLYKKCADEMDLLGVWYQAGELELIADHTTTQERTFFDFTGLEPYYYEKPWSKYLAGKKVLVISPFNESILQQYSNKDLIWPNNLLPDFELLTLKYPHSQALSDTGYSSWFSIYEEFCNKMSEMEFDVAIIGAGAATLPLAAYAKRLGRQGIGMGGSLQILFGIQGRRWDKNPFFQEVVNEYWVRPSGEEVPQAKNKVENSAYW